MGSENTLDLSMVFHQVCLNSLIRKYYFLTPFIFDPEYYFIQSSYLTTHEPVSIMFLQEMVYEVNFHVMKDKHYQYDGHH